MLFLVAAAVSVLALFNLCQPNRPTISELENRKLASMPALSIETLLDGSYFSDVSTFFSDTFFAREPMVSLSHKMDLLKSLSLIHDRDGITAIANPNATIPPSNAGDTLPTLPKLPSHSSNSSTTQPTIPPTISTLPPGVTMPTNPITPPSTTVPTAPNTQPTAPDAPVIPLVLSHTKLTLTTGASQTITATIGNGFTNLIWHCTNTDAVTVTSTGANTAVITAVSETNTTADVTAYVQSPNGTIYYITCTVTVTVPEIQQPDNEANFLPNGMFIYNGAAYSQSRYAGDKKTQSFATLYDYYAQRFPSTRISVIPAPMATITITDPKVLSEITDEGAILDKMATFMPDSVNFVNLKNVLREHANEYLYFKSDHHWTHLGAYYAYSEFAKSIGLTPTDLNAFEKQVLTTSYIGSMAKYTGVEQVKSFYDTIDAYLPTKSCTMTINSTAGIVKRDYCIATHYTTYTAFLRGDNAFTVINVPSNPQDKSVLVIKDSFGNAFVPYLTEHYGNIYVVDPRYVSMDLYEQFKDTNLTDIIFLITLQSAANDAWYKYFYNAIT